MQSVSGQWAVPALFIILGNNNINTIFETDSIIHLNKRWYTQSTNLDTTEENEPLNITFQMRQAPTL